MQVHLFYACRESRQAVLLGLGGSPQSDLTILSHFLSFYHLRTREIGCCLCSLRRDASIVGLHHARSVKYDSSFWYKEHRYTCQEWIVFSPCPVYQSMYYQVRELSSALFATKEETLLWSMWTLYLCQLHFWKSIEYEGERLVTSSMYPILTS